MNTAVIEHETSATTTRPAMALAQSVTPMVLLQQALSQNVDIEKMTQLMDLQERWERNEARKAFVVAINAFKADPPTIHKNKDVAYGNTKYSHATLDNVSAIIGAALAKHGISHRWEVEQNEGGAIKVTCVLTHALGHSERVPMEAKADSSGAKNSIQAIGSAVTYLQRYTLLAAAGMATTDDNDGRGTGDDGATERIEKFVADWTAKFDEVSTEADLKVERTKSREAAKTFGKDAEAMYLALRGVYAKRLEAVKGAA